MSEAKKHRPTQEIQAEYQQLAFKAGNLQYAIVENGKDLSLINSTMRDLNLEFAASKAAEDTASKASAVLSKENA